MTLTQIDDLDLDEVISIKQKTKQSYAELAEELLGDRGLGTALRSRVRKYQNAVPTIPDADIDQTYPVLQARGNALVIADIHTPYQHTELLKMAIQVAREHDIAQIDIAGDLHNFSALSSVAKHEPQTAVETDIKHARRILKVLQYHFDAIHIMSGNHDEYYTKKRGGTFQDLIYNDVLLGQADHVHVTNYDYIYRDDNWLIGHLSSYDEIPGLLAAKIASIHGRNVAVGHDHIAGMIKSHEGYYGISIGAMLQPELFYYKKRRLTTFPEFMLGFLLLIDGKPIHYRYEKGQLVKYEY